jgi:hypothetical protein
MKASMKIASLYKIVMKFLRYQKAFPINNKEIWKISVVEAANSLLTKITNQFTE